MQLNTLQIPYYTGTHYRYLNQTVLFKVVLPDCIRFLTQMHQTCLKG
jgi:hypothetical protein